MSQASLNSFTRSSAETPGLPRKYLSIMGRISGLFMSASVGTEKKPPAAKVWIISTIRR